MLTAGYIFLSALIISFLLTWPLVWLLPALRLDQPIREEAPATHNAKAGTPTLGGIGFLLAITVLTVVIFDFDLNLNFFAILLLMIAFALIGLFDDLNKIFRRRNLGLTFWQKLLFQILAAGFYALFLVWQGQNLPAGGFLYQLGFYNPFIYQLLVVFMVVGAANATNLTDGLNGLLGGSAFIAFVFMALLALRFGNSEVQLFSLICAGALVPFLYFNFPKAKIFMGDVGSLPLGALLAALALMLHKELRLVIIGGVFVVETLSVIIQVTAYKLWKRRVFKMTPLHHTFELLGWRETVIVPLFWLAALLCGLIGVGF